MEYQLDGTYYPPVEGVAPRTLDRYLTYQFYFDNFGRVLWAEEVSSDKNLAIVDNIYESNDGETMYVKLIYKDGTSGSVTLGTKLQNDKHTEDDIRSWIWDSNGDKVNPVDRVVTYRLNSSNELTAIDHDVDRRFTEDGTFKESSNKIGSYTISDTTSALVVKEDGKDWEISYLDPSTLIDGDKYDAYFYSRSSNGVYGLAIVKDNTGGWSKSSQMAAFVSLVTTSNDNYDYELELYTPDESKDITRLYLSDEYYDDTTVSEEYRVTYEDLERGRVAEGTPIIYTTDSSGAVTRVRRVFSDDANFFGSGIDNFNELRNYAWTDNLLDCVDKSFTNPASENADHDETYKLVFGIIVDQSGYDVDFLSKLDYDNDAQTYTVNTVSDDIESYSITDDTAVYAFDFGGQSRYNTLVTEKNTSSIRSTSFVGNNLWLDDDETIADINVLSKPQFAVARVLGDDIMEIMIFVPTK